jgi:hypothetical protein
MWIAAAGGSSSVSAAGVSHWHLQLAKLMQHPTERETETAAGVAAQQHSSSSSSNQILAVV